MVQAFSENMTEALDEIAPMKTVTIRSGYKFALSDNTKDLILYLSGLNLMAPILNNEQ